jgi:adenosylcobinamide-GDP ribazoletransferase
MKLKGIVGLISFSTIIPLNIHTTIEEMASFTWFWPIIGGLIGIFVGVVGFLSSNILHLPPLITAAIVYSFAIWFTGFHHLDGLMDMGDGLMVHGDHNKKIEVMRDMSIGTGGISLFFIIAIITFSTISAIPSSLIFLVLLISEIAAKMSLLTCATFSKSLDNGTGRFFIDSMNIPLLILSLILTSAIGFFAINITGILGIIGGLIGGAIVAIIASKHFRHITGDVLGASNEIGRAVSLIVMITYLLNF